jgi:AcrR family transcriptional regulator
MAPSHTADGQRTRQAILDAALHAFAEKGYFGSSLRDIATAVDVRESALYNHFPSKEALFNALIIADQQSRADRLSAVMAEPITDVRVTLIRFVVRALEHFATAQQQQLFRILMSDGIRLARDSRINLFERMSGGQNHLHDLMRQLMRKRCLRAADPQLLAMEFMGPLLVWRQLDAIGLNLPLMKNPQAFARAHVEQFLRGAAVRTLGRVVGKRGNARAPSARRSKTRPVHTRVDGQPER